MPSLIDSLLDVLKCRYKGINEELEWRCVYFISALVVTVYYSSYEILVKEMGFTFSVVFLTITTLIALIALIKSLTEKKKKKYLITHSGFKWAVTRYKNNVISVSETPYCLNHEAPLVDVNYNFKVCPICDLQKEYHNDEISNLHCGAISAAEADKNRSIKLDKRYIPA